MSEDMQQDSVDCATKYNPRRFNVEKDNAAFTNKEFGRK
jgi:hypothetical protein